MGSGSTIEALPGNMEAKSSVETRGSLACATWHLSRSCSDHEHQVRARPCACSPPTGSVAWTCWTDGAHFSEACLLSALAVSLLIQHTRPWLQCCWHAAYLEPAPQPSHSPVLAGRLCEAAAWRRRGAEWCCRLGRQGKLLLEPFWLLLPSAIRLSCVYLSTALEIDYLRASTRVGGESCMQLSPEAEI